MNRLDNMPVMEKTKICIDWLIAEYDETRDIKYLESIREMQELTRIIDSLEDLYQGNYKKEIWA